MTDKPRRIVARIALIALTTLSASVGSSTLSSAAPNAKDVEAAKDRLDALNVEMDQLVEQYNQAKLRLQEVQERLKAVQLDALKAQSEADKAVASLNANASHAYQGIGSQIEVLFADSG